MHCCEMGCIVLVACQIWAFSFKDNLMVGCPARHSSLCLAGDYSTMSTYVYLCIYTWM